MNKTPIQKTLTILLVFLITLTPLAFAQTPTAISDHNMVKDLSSNLMNQYTSSGAFAADLFTGSASYGYPIAVPPGVNGLVPSIALSYNHQQTALIGILGTAWSLNNNYIYRDVKGTLSNTADDVFKLHFNGVDVKLIYSNGKYHTEVEQYLRIEKKTGANNQNNEYWTVKTKEGTTYRFGYNQNSELAANQGIFLDWESFTSMWNLDSITDTYGNSIIYDYIENPSEDNYPYLTKISYNQGISEIKFNYTYDAFNGFNGYSYGTKIKQNGLLNRIEIENNGNLVRKYELEYQTINNKKFLQRIRLFGTDGSSQLPVTEFSYNIPEKGWETTSDYLVPSEAYFGQYKDEGVRLIDLNGDGFDDVIKMADTNNMDYWLNNKNNGWQSKQTYSNLLEGGIVNDWGQDLGVRFFDIDRDSKLDIIKLVKDESIVKKILTREEDNWVEKVVSIPEEVAFIRKLEATTSCEPPSCPDDFTAGPVSCANGNCNRTCIIEACTESETVVKDSYSTTEPEWYDDNHVESDNGEDFTPSQQNKCYKFEFTGSEKEDDDGSDCYNLETDDYYGNPGMSCHYGDLDAYAGIGFIGSKTDDTWLNTIPPTENSFYLGGSSDRKTISYDWKYRYISEYEKDETPDSDGEWSSFNSMLCSKTHSIYCTPSESACSLWGKDSCGYGCSDETTYPFITLGIYESYNNNVWDALYDNWDCKSSEIMNDNDYEGKQNHYKVTEYSTTTHYEYMQCRYAADEYIDTGIRLADVNSDGRTDVLKSTNQERKVWINTDKGFMLTDNWKIPDEAIFLNPYEKKDQGTRVADINGDGLPDLIKGKDATIKIWVNTGKGWALDYTWTLPQDAVFIVNHGDRGVVFLDVDADGLIDIVRADSLMRKVWINTGSGWVEDTSWSVPSSMSIVGPSSTIADINGDGLSDLLLAESPTNRNVWKNKASKGYLLSKIKNMYGGTTTINYKQMTLLDNTGDDNINDLPFPGWVVSSITKNNGLSGSHQVISTINYNHSGGLYDSDDKEFRGFRYVSEILPSGSVIKHTFNQDKSRKGLEQETRILDSNNNLFKRTDYRWLTELKPAGYYVIYLKEVVDYTYDGAE
ncbi:MAG: toxin TcdB middle/N-terminal domain-containing protein [Nanoarchaeota archaeon]|nr:toxin TcdB middle/N-terminal domain-containing protein [Nanoarchaeota archaeon]